jgi:hypothetical protein
LLEGSDAMKNTKRCGECGESKIRTATVSAGGGYSPDLLPGAHPWWKGGTLEIYICGVCGHLQFFVPEKQLDDVATSEKFADVT